MKGGIDMSFNFDEINEVLKQAKILDVVSYYCKVIKNGKNYKAICPFHNDTDPSMQINVEKNIFKCFVCNEGGHPVTFVEKIEKCSWVDAVKKVCEICHLDLPQSFLNYKKKPLREKKNGKELEAVSKLADFYHFSLATNQGHEAELYLLERGLDEDVINHFNLGYAPLDTKKSISYLTKKENYSIELLSKAGLLSSHDIVDRYEDRIMFPVSNIEGDIVGFSGRRYKKGDESLGKYVNSPESEIFNKSTLLYNYNNAKKTCKRDGYLYVVEGFMDVIALYRANITSSVAIMGTAITKEHISLFKNLGVEIRLCLDSDEAGQLAENKNIPVFLKEGISFKVVSPFRGGKDADEVLKALGKEELINQINSLDLPLSHSLRYLTERNLLDTLEKKEAFLSKYMPYLPSSKLARELIIDEISTSFDMKREIIVSYMKDYDFVKNKNRVEKKEIDHSVHVHSNLEKIDIYSAIGSYVSKVIPEVKLSLNKRSLMNTETQILIEMLTCKEKFDYFVSAHFIFGYDVFNLFMGYIGDYYKDNLTQGVKYILREDKDYFEGKINEYESFCIEYNSDNKNELNKCKRQKVQSLEICERIFACKMPANGDVFDKMVCDMLLNRHKNFTLKYENELKKARKTS